MGTLRKYNLSQCPCEYFFETGTGLGSSLKHALHNGDFKKIFSTEIHSNTAAKAQLLFKKYRNVEIRNEKSTISLGKILPTLSKTDSILFFLDAHFPGEVSKGFKYENNEPNSLTMPLKEELKIIKSIRPDSEDILIIDDLNLYEDGPFQNGNIIQNYANITNKERDLSFIEDIFSDREIHRDYRDEGYLIIKPISCSFMLENLPQIYRLKRSLIKNANRYLGAKFEER